MGSFLDNTHVRVADASAEEVRHRIEAAVRQRLTAAGLEEAPSREGADRVVWLCESEGWVSLTDSEFGQGQEWAKALSKATGADTICHMVFDSDSGKFDLYRGGKRASGADAWGPLLREGTTAAEFKRLARSRPVFAEEKTAALAELVKLTQSVCNVTEREIASRGGEGYFALAFRSKGSEQSKATPALGAMANQLTNVECPLGHLCDSAVAQFVGRGGAGTGLRFEVSGSAVESGLVAVDSLEVTRFLNADQQRDVRDVRWNSSAVEMADLAAPTAPRSTMRFGSMLVSLLPVRVRVKGLRSGAGELVVRAVPLENPEGAAEVRLPLTVMAEMRVPLGGLTSAMPMMACGMMGRPVTLLGFATFDCAQAEAEEAAKAAVAQWRSAGGELFWQQLATAVTWDQTAPQLTLWTRDATKAGVLEEALDALAETGLLAQAFEAHWDWTPGQLPATPYEMALGIMDARPLARGWCQRYFRAVTPKMWLGRMLMAVLGMPAGLSEVAEVTKLGRVVKLSLREGRKLEELEEVLSPLRPGAMSR